MSDSEDFLSSDIYKSDTGGDVFDSENVHATGDAARRRSISKDVAMLGQVPSLKIGSVYNSVESFSGKVSARFPSMMASVINTLSPRPNIVSPSGKRVDDVEDLEYAEPLMGRHMSDSTDIDIEEAKGSNEDGSDDDGDGDDNGGDMVRLYSDKQVLLPSSKGGEDREEVLSGRRSRRHSLAEF